MYDATVAKDADKLRELLSQNAPTDYRNEKVSSGLARRRGSATRGRASPPRVVVQGTFSPEEFPFSSLLG